MEPRETHFERFATDAGWVASTRIYADAIAHPAAEFDLAYESILPKVLALADFIESTGRSPGESLRIAKTQSHTWMYMRAVAESGNQVYAPTLALSKALLHTHIRNLSCAELRLPFPAIYVMAPEGLGFHLQDQSTCAYHELDGVYFVQTGNVLRTQVVGRPADGTRMDDTVLEAPLRLGDGALHDAIEQMRLQPATLPGITGEGASWTKAAQQSRWVDIMAWACRTVIYATCAERREEIRNTNPQLSHLRRLIAGASKPKRRARLHANAAAVPPWRRIVLGHDHEGEGEGRGTSPAGHMVEGHFQRYHTAEGTVRRWKAPYRRGLDGGDPQRTDRVLT